MCLQLAPLFSKAGFVLFIFFFSSKIFNFTDVLLYYVLAIRQFRYPTSLQWAMLSQLLWITMCYVEPLVVNHCVFCWASYCEPLWFILSQWLWTIVSYAEPVVVNHGVLCWAIDCESLWVLLSQWLWNIVSYAESVVLDDGLLSWASGCETLWVIMSSVCRNHGLNAVPVGVNHGQLC